MKAPLRDRIAWRLANWVLNTIATTEYRTQLRIILDVGMKVTDKYLEKTEANA